MQKMSNAASDTHDHGPPPSANPSAHTARTAPVSALAKYMAQTPKSSIDAVCGALGGVASGIVTCPLDVIKTKLQAQGGFRQQQSLKNAPSSSAIYHGMVGTARSIARQDGVRGFYRGLSPMLLGYFPTWGVYMSVYGIAKDFYYTEIGEYETSAQCTMILTYKQTTSSLPRWLPLLRLARVVPLLPIPSGLSRHASWLKRPGMLLTTRALPGITPPRSMRHERCTLPKV